MKKIADQTLRRMIAAAIDARGRSYSPYSGYAVGAALLTDDGNIHAGCNVENAAYPLGFCAEANAIGTMVASGARRISHVVIAGPNADLCAPCGGCRQQLREFAGDGQMPVTICDVDGEILLETSLQELLPTSFGPEAVNSIHKTNRVDD